MADGSGAVVGVPDGVVDSLDYAFWKANFGNTLVFGAASVELVVNSALAEPVAPSNKASFGNTLVMGGSGSTAEDPHPLDNSRPLPAGEAIRVARPEPRDVVPVRLAITGSDDALLAWLARRFGGDTTDGGDVEVECGSDAPAESAVAKLDEAFAALDGSL